MRKHNNYTIKWIFWDMLHFECYHNILGNGRRKPKRLWSQPAHSWRKDEVWVRKTLDAYARGKDNKEPNYGQTLGSARRMGKKLRSSNEYRHNQNSKNEKSVKGNPSWRRSPWIYSWLDQLSTRLHKQVYIFWWRPTNFQHKMHL